MQEVDYSAKQHKISLTFSLFILPRVSKKMLCHHLEAIEFFFCIISSPILNLFSFAFLWDSPPFRVHPTSRSEFRILSSFLLHSHAEKKKEEKLSCVIFSTCFALADAYENDFWIFTDFWASEKYVASVGGAENLISNLCNVISRPGKSEENNSLPQLESLKLMFMWTFFFPCLFPLSVRQAASVGKILILCVGVASYFFYLISTIFLLLY